MGVRHGEADGAAGGDAFAESLVERFFGPVRRYVCMRVRASDAEDVVADVFLRALERREQLRSADAGAWIFSIARSRVADHYRRKGKRVPAEKPIDLAGRSLDLRGAGSPNALDALEREEFVALLRAKLGELSEAEQDAISLKFTDGLTNGEIASLLGVTPNSLGVMLHRALSKLRQAMLKEAGNA